MAKRNTPPQTGKTQHQRFVEAAEELGLNESSETFRSIVRKIATAPVTKPKKAATKRKG